MIGYLRSKVWRNKDEGRADTRARRCVQLGPGDQLHSQSIRPAVHTTVQPAPRR